MSNTETTETNGGVGGSGSGGADDIFKPTRQAVDELYDAHDHFYSPNLVEKLSKMKELIISALQLLDSIPEEKLYSTTRYATYEYLRGKILDSLPIYKKEAEENLARAVRWKPSLGDAWLSLGNCMWKKGELMVARNCMMLALSKAPSKRILCLLSTLERRMAEHQDSKVAEVLVIESIKHARAAIAMDVTDGYPWFCLGNARMNSFFETGAWDLTELEHSLKAYQIADADAKMKCNPYLSFNGASVNRYLEDYKRALSGFEAAAAKSPDLTATQEIRKMVELFDTMGMYLSAQTQARGIAILGSLRSPVKSSLLPSLDAVKLDPPYKRATLDMLQEGVNKAFAIVGKVLLSFDNENRMPLYYTLCDSDYQCYILSIYGTRANAIKEGDQVTILDPCYRHQDFSWKGKRYVFESLRVDFVKQVQVRVNGKALSPETARRSKFAKLRPI